jgi:hypothetical protein
MQQPWRQRIDSSPRALPDAFTLTQSEGYGFGLLSTVDSRLGHSVAHGGGLPGYGTFYRLLPERNLGLVAFANLTYSAPRPALNEAFTLLINSGGAPKRTLPPSAALLAAQQTISSLYEQWDDNLITSQATDSFFMYQPVFQDQPLEGRREQFAALHKRFGKCLSVTAIEPEDALRGRWTMRCRKGRIEVFVTMASYAPPQIQMMQLTTVKPLSPALKQTTQQIVELIGAWDDAKARALLARTAKPDALRVQFEALRALYGALRLGDALEGDGQTQAVVRLHGRQNDVDLKVEVNPRTGKVTKGTFTTPRDTSYLS